MHLLKLFAAAVIAASFPIISAGHAQGPKEITIAMGSKSMVTSKPRIADEMGLFAKHGLKARFVYTDTANATVAALISGSVNFAIAAPPDVIVAQSRGQQIAIVGTVYGGLSGSLILAKSVADKLGVAPNAPIAQRLKALDNVLIASPSATSNFTTVYKGAANAAGANPRFTYVGLPAMQAALETGAVQGYISSSPGWTVPVLNGTGVLWIAATDTGLASDYMPVASGVLLAMRNFVNENRETMKAMNAVTDDFARAIEERPNDVRAAILRLFPELNAATLDLLLPTLMTALKAKPLTPADVAHEIKAIELSGIQAGDLKALTPANLLWSAN